MDLIAPYLRKKIESFENEEGIEAFREAVKNAANTGAAVETFSLMGNSYGKTFFAELAPFVEKFSVVKKLVLNDIFAQRDHDVVESLNLITKMFAGKDIVAFDFSNNAIAPTGCQAIFELLKNADKLQYLWANNCGLAQNGVIHIAKAIEESTAPIKYLSMGRNRIEVKALEVGRAVATLPQLEELLMYQNGIKEEGMAGLLTGLLSCPKLRKLDLRDNWIIGTSLDLLGQVIEQNTDLVDLDLGDCNLDKPDHPKILEALKKADRAWVGFGYDYNELTSKSTAKAFLEQLAKHKSLKVDSTSPSDFP